MEAIKNNALYKRILADSFGGVMYNVANYDKYDIQDMNELIQLWHKLTPAEQEGAGGIMKGAMNFLLAREF